MSLVALGCTASVRAIVFHKRVGILPLIDFTNSCASGSGVTLSFI